MNYFTDRVSISKRELSPEGYLIVRDSKLARTGVLQYRKFELGSITDAPTDLKRDQVIRVYRGPEELFSDKVLDSFKSKPITLQHPDELVDARSFKDASVGFSKEDVLSNDGKFMIGSLVISDAEAIRAVQSGVKELSLGYTAEIVWQPGRTEDGEVYDAVQRNIQGNHIAIVPKGRCGDACKISDTKTQTKGDTMSIVIDGISYECPEQTAQAVQKILDSKASLEKDFIKFKDGSAEEMKKLEDEKEELKKDYDETQAKLDEAEKNKMNDSDLDALVAERASLVSDAQTVVKDFKPEGLSNFEIKKAVVKDACPELDADAKSNDYIEARFDAILDSAKASNKSSIKDAMTDHADSKTGDETGLMDSQMSLSEIKRAEKIANNKKK